MDSNVDKRNDQLGGLNIVSYREELILFKTNEAVLNSNRSLIISVSITESLQFVTIAKLHARGDGMSCLLISCHASVPGNASRTCCARARDPTETSGRKRTHQDGWGRRSCLRWTDQVEKCRSLQKSRL